LSFIEVQVATDAESPWSPTHSLTLTSSLSFGMKHYETWLMFMSFVFHIIIVIVK
jgi:hypothetical protein